jgi:hypothetical protein
MVPVIALLCCLHGYCVLAWCFSELLWLSTISARASTLLLQARPTGCLCLQALQQAGINNAACVVLGTGGGHPTDAEADARVLAALLQVRPQ